MVILAFVIPTPPDTVSPFVWMISLAVKVVVEMPTAVTPVPATRSPFATVYKVDHATLVVEIPLVVTPRPCTVIPSAVSKLLVAITGVTI